MAQFKYWKECMENAAEECGMTLTEEQLETFADFAKSGHDFYDQAFYTPSWTDRFDDMENEWKRKLKDKENELREYKQNAETAVKVALKQRPDDLISIGKHGEVTLYAGRTYQIQ